MNNISVEKDIPRTYSNISRFACGEIEDKYELPLSSSSPPHSIFTEKYKPSRGR
jgi:hypothetical protein